MPTTNADDQLRFIADIRESLEKTQGDDDVASHIDTALENIKHIITVLIREGLAEENEFTLEID